LNLKFDGLSLEFNSLILKFNGLSLEFDVMNIYFFLLLRFRQAPNWQGITCNYKYHLIL